MDQHSPRAAVGLETMAAGTAVEEDTAGVAKAMGLAAVEAPVATGTAERAGTATMGTAAHPEAIPAEATQVPGTRAEGAQMRATKAEGAATVPTTLKAGAEAILVGAAKAAGPPEVSAVVLEAARAPVRVQATATPEEAPKVKATAATKAATRPQALVAVQATPETAKDKAARRKATPETQARAA
jgi:hypothetical protein